MYKLEEKVCKPWTISRISALITSAKNRIFSAVVCLACCRFSWKVGEHRESESIFTCAVCISTILATQNGWSRMNAQNYSVFDFVEITVGAFCRYPCLPHFFHESCSCSVFPSFVDFVSLWIDKNPCLTGCFVVCFFSVMLCLHYCNWGSKQLVIFRE